MQVELYTYVLDGFRIDCVTPEGPAAGVEGMKLFIPTVDGIIAAYYMTIT